MTFDSNMESNNKKSKKLVIQNLQSKTDSDKLDLASSWDVLYDSVVKIKEKKKANSSCEDLYNLVQSLCQYNQANTIYERLQQLIRQFASDGHETLLENTKNVPPFMFLQELDNLWNGFCNEMLMVRSIFLYMDRAHRRSVNLTISIWDYSLEAFCMCVINKPHTKQYTVKSLLELITEERSGAQVDRYLLKSVLRMFINLQIYESVFEPEFLSATKKLYENESRAKLQEMEISAYLRHVFKRIAEEQDRIDVYLDVSTAKKLINITDTCFLSNDLNQIITRATPCLYAEKRLEDLTLLYDLMLRVKGGLIALKASFSEYAKKVGCDYITDTTRDKTLVQDLMNFKANLDIIVSTCFRNNEKFIQAEKDAFDYFINTRPNRPAELIAKFMDSKLKTGNKECSDDELDVVMDKVITLFRFIEGKDVFEAFYKKDLAKRLLLGRSASVDAEKAMLSKLKNECGSGFTQKLEGMFKDMEVSKDLCAAFKQHLESIGRSESSVTHRPEVNVHILAVGNWPSYPDIAVNVPPELSYYLDLCKQFYDGKYSGRKLTWQHSVGSAILKARFCTTVSKELDVSLFQAIVLLLFNQKKKLPYKEIQEKTNIEALELKRTLQSLACGKHRVIQKEPRGRDVDDNDDFEFNDKFDVHLYRIRISQIQMRETEEEHKQTEEQIFQDRQYQIDAAVVRIMKTRKELQHNQLLSELFGQLRFRSKPADLKKRIESLIEREYIIRDKEDNQKYHYVT